MIVHLPMLRIIVPANVAMMLEIVIPIAMFDLLDDFDWDELRRVGITFNNDEQAKLEDKMFDQIQDIGYESHNSI